MASSSSVGDGFPTSLRTLKKDIQYVRRQYPSLPVDLIEEVLIDTIPKEAHIPSTCANLEVALARLKAHHEVQLRARKKSLRR